MTNIVDYLKTEIDKLQSICKHDWIITKPYEEPKLSLSLGIYIGIVGVYGPRGSSFILTCSKCSKERSCGYTVICPGCFERLIPDERLSSRDHYHEMEALDPIGYYNTRVSRCPNNDFAVANDEFDQ